MFLGLSPHPLRGNPMTQSVLFWDDRWLKNTPLKWETLPEAWNTLCIKYICFFGSSCLLLELCCIHFRNDFHITVWLLSGYWTSVSIHYIRWVYWKSHFERGCKSYYQVLGFIHHWNWQLLAAGSWFLLIHVSDQFLTDTDWNLQTLLSVPQQSCRISQQQWLTQEDMVPKMGVPQLSSKSWMTRT